ncbi:WD repeat domain phosphoinositide-interacting protein 2 isoform X1 [Drosophila willistoni]|uniref:WD repeat domain phosphoinositide-interacting protein 2 isoform X1 n=1 Tax=Drosophila willistoni TaxID=7260 RepID=UPI000C26D8A1|nr:WD repeat domain phosphoinositide-interacting protein 2 isoform X1 [Drosophila willistoni]
MSAYQMNFNQDFTSLSVLSATGLRLYSIAGQEVEEIFAKDNTEQIRIVERLFNSSLIVLVTKQKPNCLKMLHFKKKQDICNCFYPSEILCVRMNRQRLIVCLAESIHIHDIRDMKILHSIVNIAPNEQGLCALSLNSHLAFPICQSSGELRIFNASKLRTGMTIKAHDTPLSALTFSPSGALLATASERGTVIRVFCVKNGQRVQEFRRGVSCVRIFSLVFAANGDFLCASSNTETVHVFKIDARAVESAELKAIAEVAAKADNANKEATSSPPTADESSNNTTTAATVATSAPSPPPASWGGMFSKAVSSLLLPTQVSDVLAQDRSFATVVLAQPGLKHICAITRVQRELRLLIACEDGFLYVHEFNAEKGGVAKLLSVHDLRGALEDVIELQLTESQLGRIQSKPTSATTQQSLTMPKSCAASVLIENPEPMPDNSYAGILRGDQADAMSAFNSLIDSAKFRKLCDAIDTPTKLYDERQFPPVAIAAKD